MKQDIEGLPGRLRGKVAVVTGAASGIGNATARAFAAAGARLVLADLDEEALASLANEVREAGGDAVSIRTDVASPEAVGWMFKEASAKYGGFDIVFNGAGILFQGTVLETDDATWARVMAVNLTGTFLCCREAIRIWRGAQSAGAASRTQGLAGLSIVNVSSTTGGHDATASAVAYVCSKAGVAMLTKALAVDHARDGVRVNAICPGPTDTPMLRKIMDADRVRAFAESFPMKRLGRPEEIAAAAVFLASDESSFMTGSLMTVDGGQTAEV